MKNPISPRTLVVVFSVVAVAAIVSLIMFFRDGGPSGPPLKPKPWRPPAQWAGAPSQTGGMGAGPQTTTTTGSGANE